MARIVSALGLSSARACAVCFGLTHDNRGLILGITIGVCTLAAAVYSMIALIVKLCLEAERERALRGV